MSDVTDLATRQLEAYNRADLDAFCACFHDEVCVLGEDGAVQRRGIADFRAAYGAMFSEHLAVEASVESRVALSPHVVEHERWSRVRVSDGVRLGGEVLVRYTAEDGKIRWVQFFRP
ncbi:hypothetical protein BH09MYX1_BH09MYX1_25630 [soil metagenome]